MAARAAATEIVTIWQLAENSTSFVKLKCSKGTASILTGQQVFVTDGHNFYFDRCT
jgi:hypothetical protein